MRLVLILGAIVSVFMFSVEVLADSVTMKNGDVYKGTILKEEFNNYLQLQLRDGSEKHLIWSDVSSVERTPSDPAPVSANETHRREDRQDEKPESNDRFEFDLTGFSYDSLWENLSLTNGSGVQTAQGTTSVHNILTNPEDLTVRAYLSRWHIFLQYFTDQGVLSSTLNTQVFANTAITFAVSKYVDLGVDLLFNRQGGSVNGVSGTDYDYFFGPYVRVVAPLSDSFDFEPSASAGIIFRDLSVSNSTTSASADGVGFGAMASLYGALAVSNHASLLFGVDGFMVLGSLGAGNSSLSANLYRLRAVPLGLRIKF